MKFGSSGPSSDPAVTSGPQSQSQAAVSSPADSGGGPSTNNVIGATPSREETMGVFDVVEGELHTLTNLITLIFRVIQHESECPTDYKARFVAFLMSNFPDAFFIGIDLSDFHCLLPES